MKKSFFKKLLGITILSSSILLAGCGKEETFDVRTEYFKALASASNFNKGNYEIVLETKTPPEKSIENSLAESIVNVDESIKNTIKIDGILEQKNPLKISANITYDSSISTLENNNITDIVITDKSIYLNLSKILKSLNELQQKQKEAQVEDDSTTSLLSFIDFESDEIKSLFPKDYLLINIDELNEYSKEDSSLDVTSLSDNENLKLLKSIMSDPKKEVALKATLLQLFNGTESLYENTIINFDEENQYFYISLTADELKSFIDKFLGFVDMYFEEILSKNLSNYETEMTKEEITTLKILINTTLTKLKNGELSSTDINNNVLPSEIEDNIDDKNIELDGTYVFALFPGNAGAKIVIQNILSEDEENTLSITTISNDESQVELPTDSFSIVSLLEQIQGFFENSFLSDDTNLDFTNEIDENNETYDINTYNFVMPSNALSNKLTSKEIQVGNNVYTFPINKEMLENDGYEILNDTLNYDNDKNVLNIKNEEILDKDGNVVDNIISYLGQSQEEITTNDSYLYIILPQGIQIGKTEDDLISAYGEPSEKTTFTMGSTEDSTYIYSIDDIKYIFTLENKTISKIEVSQETQE